MNKPSVVIDAASTSSGDRVLQFYMVKKHIGPFTNFKDTIIQGCPIDSRPILFISLNDDFQIFLTWQGRTFSGSANEDSPLLQEDFTNAVSVSFVWKLFKSQRPARNSDM